VISRSSQIEIPQNGRQGVIRGTQSEGKKMRYGRVRMSRARLEKGNS